MKTEKKQRRTRGQGFTLIEVALAVAVVAVGVLGLFALLSSGLEASAQATATTQAAFFADATMNALRAESAKQAAAGRTNWQSFLTRMTAGPPQQTNLTIAATNAWRVTTLTARILAVPTSFPGWPATKLNFTNAPFHSPGLQTISSGSLWYRLVIVQSNVASRITALVTLQVWPRGGSATPTTAPLVFYSEFPDMGQL